MLGAVMICSNDCIFYAGSVISKGKKKLDIIGPNQRNCINTYNYMRMKDFELWLNTVAANVHQGPFDNME